MKGKRKAFYFIPLFFAGFVLLLGLVVMLIWNSVVTQVFDLKQISYWQAVGLFILAKLLFGFPRLGPPRYFGKGGSPWRHKLMNMSPEERENFKKQWQQRWSNKGPSSP